jgi:hypothetical protein
MATNNRGRSNRGGNQGRRGQNNNPEGYNPYNSGWIDTARERPFTAAAAVGGAVAAGVFLWSRRSQISDQIASLSDQISEWREGIGSDSSSFDTTEDSGTSGGFIARSSNRGGRKSQSQIAEEALTLKETGKNRRSTAMAGEQSL